MTNPVHDDDAYEGRGNLRHLQLWHFSAIVTAVVGLSALGMAIGGLYLTSEILLFVFVALALVTLVLRIAGI